MKFIRKIYKNFMKKIIQNTEVAPDVSQWKQLLQEMPVPRDYVDVAYNKHLCRTHYFSVFGKIVMNLASAVMLLVNLPHILKKRAPMPPVENNTLLLVQDSRISYKDIAPEELFNQYDQVELDVRKELPMNTLCAEARELFLGCVKKHPFSFWFQLLILKELSANCHYLLQHNPKATATYVVESDIAYPVVTELYERTGRKFISFMHGEYLLQIIHGYMRFSEYYVWDQSYVDMFQKDLNCQIGKYIVYTPKKLQKKWNLEEETPKYQFTYYFSGESRKTIQNIAEIFGTLENSGISCKVRPHPRFVVHVKEIFDTFQNIKVELPSEVSLRDSLAQTEYAVGLASTVLSEAYIEGRQIVVDDMSDPVQFHSLYERNASVLRKPHRLLSELYRTAAERLRQEV